MPKRQPALGLTAVLLFGLAACGDRQDQANASSEGNVAVTRGDAPVASGATRGRVFKLADGPDVCFRAVAAHLGADARISELTSFFSAGTEIDSGDDEPAGTMTTCSVEYQNPDDPRKLLGTSMTMDSGTFSPPRPIEITVSGGDASAFKLDDYLIPLAKIDAARLKTVMDGQQQRLDKIYSRHAWTGVRLSSPGPFSDVHTLRLDLDGRLASNDIKEGGYASVSVDGSKIVTDHLTP